MSFFFLAEIAMKLCCCIIHISFIPMTDTVALTINVLENNVKESLLYIFIEGGCNGEEFTPFTW